MNITELVGIGGPIGAICGLVGFLVNAYLAKRKDDREETKIERESETGIVETTKQALLMAREEMTAIHLTRAEERARYLEELNQLRSHIESLVRENDQLRGQPRGRHEQSFYRTNRSG